MMVRFVTFLCAFLSLTFAIRGQELVVQTNNGPIRGYLSSGAVAFLGIPYAAPPQGDLRWRPPQDAPAWSEVRATTSFGPPCPQKEFSQTSGESRQIGSEDCLTLNIWKPSGNSASPLPVLFFIHGGGNQQGSTSEIVGGARLYDGALLAARANVVVVTIQYRLGALGYLVHPYLDTESEIGVSGNYGLLDQQRALRWVQTNIARFGGDPAKVLVFGESGGAVNTVMHVVSPLSRDLFRSAIVQSGAAVAMTKESRLRQTAAFIDSLKLSALTESEQIARLRLLHPDSLTRFLSNPTAGGVIQMAWGPVIDGHVIPGEPGALLDQGRRNPVPLIVGSNEDEGSLMAPPTVTPIQVRAFLGLAVPLSLMTRAQQLYPPGSNNEEAKAAYIRIVTDANFTCSATRILRGLEKGMPEVPAFRYFFSHKLGGPFRQFGSFHGIELFYVFQTLDSAIYPVNARDREVMEEMRSFWRNMAENGRPDQSQAWPTWTPDADRYLDFGVITEARSGLRTEECAFWDDVRRLTTSVESSTGAANMSVYPNPTQGPLTIALKQAKGDVRSVRVLSATGEELVRVDIDVPADSTVPIAFDLEGMPSGLYIVHVIGDMFTASQVVGVVN